MLKLKLFAMLCWLLRLPTDTTIRFIPKQQKRMDTRGRTVAYFVNIKEGIAFLAKLASHEITKEKEDGSYYLAVEVRSTEVVYHHVAEPKKSDTLPLPFGDISQGLPPPPAGRPDPADAAQAAHDEAQGTAGRRGIHGLDAGKPPAARSEEPVGKVDLSQIGVR